MKNRILILAAVLVLAVAVCCGCGTAQEPETTATLCEHDWLPAGCYNPKTCKLCEATEGGPEHKYELGETIPATCTEAGQMLYFCEICDDPNTEEIPAEGHTVQDGVCITCGEKVEENS